MEYQEDFKKEDVIAVLKELKKHEGVFFDSMEFYKEKTDKPFPVINAVFEYIRERYLPLFLNLEVDEAYEDKITYLKDFEREYLPLRD